MSLHTEPSRALAAELDPGEYELYNDELRAAYALSRVTAKARREIAITLEDAGLDVLSDPDYEPLTVRKTSRAPVPAAAGSRSWKPWAIVVACVLLLVLVGALGSGARTSAGEEDARAQTSDSVQTPTPEPASTRAAEQTETLADATEAVKDDSYSEALLIAATLGDNNERHIGRRIARRLAYRAVRALRRGDRREASRLIRQAGEHPSTPQFRNARTSLRAAQARASARAAARRRAEQAARAERRARAAARRAAEEAASAVPAPDASDVAPSAPNGPSSVNWCGKRDGDGDGIYCE